MDPAALARLCEFLVEAKRRSYAGLDDDATISAPALAGSKQLEIRAGDLIYRDIYFGMRFFAGLETVLSGSQAIWGMSYAGGVSAEIIDRDELLAIYAFLRQALLAVSPDRPFRGPPSFESGGFRYANASHGDPTAFHGEERIDRDGTNVFQLRYNGGLIR
jgi:hypothetical protein